MLASPIVMVLVPLLFALIADAVSDPSLRVMVLVPLACARIPKVPKVIESNLALPFCISRVVLPLLVCIPPSKTISEF